MQLFHGTSSARLDRIRKEGLRQPYLTDREDIAQYYAETVAEEEGGEPYVLTVEASEASFKADYPAFEEPLDLYRDDYAATDKEWNRKIDSGKTPYPKNESDWKTSLKVVHSVKCSTDIAPNNITFPDAPFKSSRKPIEIWTPNGPKTIYQSIACIKEVLGGADCEWVDITKGLPGPRRDVLCWDGHKRFVGYYDFEDTEDKKVAMVWHGSWSSEFDNAPVKLWAEIPEIPFTTAAVNRLKFVLCNQAPEQIGADIGGQVTDYDIRVPFDREPKGGQHPEFVMKDGPRESLDK